MRTRDRLLKLKRLHDQSNTLDAAGSYAYQNARNKNQFKWCRRIANLHPSSGNEFRRTAMSRASETSWRGASRPASCVARRDRQGRAWPVGPRAQLRQLVSRHRACGRHSGCGLWNMNARAGGATEADEAGAPRSFRKSRKRAIASAPRPPPQKKHASRRIFPPPGGVRNVPTCFLILGGSHLAISASPESQGSSIPVEARVEGSSAIARSPFSEALFSYAFSFAR